MGERMPGRSIGISVRDRLKRYVKDGMGYLSSRCLVGRLEPCWGRRAFWLMSLESICEVLWMVLFSQLTFDGGVWTLSILEALLDVGGVDT